MSSVVSLLTPNIKIAEDYKRTGEQLYESYLEYLNKTEQDPILFSVDEYDIVGNIPLIYNNFVRIAFRHGRGLFMTLEEIKTELRRFNKIEETVKSMLDKGILKEVYMEWPPNQTPLCPFCGKPYAYPIKTRKLFFFKRISAWSCTNERCRMYGKHYLL